MSLPVPDRFPDRFDVVIVPFPFVDMPVAKKRPAVVLSEHAFNAATGTAIMAMITSANDSDWPDDTPVQDRDQAGLRSPCKLRMKLFTLDLSFILQCTGRLSGRDASALEMALKRVVGL